MALLRRPGQGAPRPPKESSLLFVPGEDHEPSRSTCREPGPVRSSVCPRRAPRALSQPECLSGPNALSLCPLRASSWGCEGFFPFIYLFFSPNGKINHRVSPALRSAMWLWSLGAAGHRPAADTQPSAGPASRPSRLGPGLVSRFPETPDGAQRVEQVGKPAPRGRLGEVFLPLKIVLEPGPGAEGQDVRAVPLGGSGLWVTGSRFPAPESGAVGSLLYLPQRLAAGRLRRRPELEAGHLGRRPKACVPWWPRALEADGDVDVKVADRSCFLN